MKIADVPEIKQVKKIVAFYRLSKVDESLISHLKEIEKRRARKEVFEDHINTQRELVAEAVKKIEGGVIIGEYSAKIKRHKIKNCLPFQQALDHAIKEKADIMASTFDRLGEEIYFVFGIKEKLSRYGLKLLFADYLDADEMILAIKLAISKKERELICKRQRDKAKYIKKYGSKSGKPSGNPHFKDGRFKKRYDNYRRIAGKACTELSLRNEVNRMNSSYIIEAKKAGNTFEEIAQKLNDMGRVTLKGLTFTKPTCIKLYYKFIKYYERSFKVA